MGDELYYGTPPHVGWWATYVSVLNKRKHHWRWWDGDVWSHRALYTNTASQASRIARMKRPADQKFLWSYYWPENGRVQRVDPTTGKVTGEIYGK
jgi:hypothetical protein